MILKLLVLLLPLLATGPVITKTDPNTPASLSVGASSGDKTYCVATASPTIVKFSLTCQKNGITEFTSNVIISTTVVSSGDEVWIFNFDPINTNVVRFQVAENKRTAGLVTSTFMGSQGMVTWPIGTMNGRNHD